MKTVWANAHVGSNPTLSAINENPVISMVAGFFPILAVIKKIFSKFYLT